MSDDVGQIHQRLQRLESSNRRLGVAVAVLSAVIALLGATPARFAPDVVSASSFRVVDASGAVVTSLESRESGPGLFIMDSEGRERVALVHDSEQTALFLKDENGHSRVGAAQFAHGGGGFALHGEDMKGAAVLYLKDTKGSLSIIDSEGIVVRRVPEKTSSN
jgi:hypothetical protein